MIPIQTTEEQERILDLGKDGMVICMDLNTEEGRIAATDMAHMSAEVRAAFTLTVDKANVFLLALYTKDAERMIVALSDRQFIRQAIKTLHAHLRDGASFSFAIIPPDQTILDIVTEISGTAGSA